MFGATDLEIALTASAPAPEQATSPRSSTKILRSVRERTRLSVVELRGRPPFPRPMGRASRGARLDRPRPIRLGAHDIGSRARTSTIRRNARGNRGWAQEIPTRGTLLDRAAISDGGFVYGRDDHAAKTRIVTATGCRSLRGAWGASRPFRPRPRQRNGTSTRRSVLQRNSKLSGGRTEESHHGIAGRGLRDCGGPRNRACT
jgi:hypothetical protein